MIDRVRGTIRRRILLNFRIDPDVARRRLPPGFEPKLIHGRAMGGICLIRLEHERPFGVPRAVGLSSENAAHRFAALRVREDGTREDCVYIARRHSASLLNRAVGGRLLMTEHQAARFNVAESNGAIDLRLSSRDGFDAHVRARHARALPSSSAFRSLSEASDFFRTGAVGYSEKRGGAALDVVRLEAPRWEITPLDVEAAESSYFSDRTLFPEGTIELDCALLMSDIEHAWIALPTASRTHTGTIRASLRPL